MSKPVVLHKLEIEKANQEDWNEILNILEETKLTHWFIGGENYKNFYTVREPISKKIICCFSIATEGDIGILKSFAVRINYQGKGIGKLIANKTPELAKKIKLKKIYAASAEAPDFWNKTIFKEINIKEANEPYYLSYIKKMEVKFPEVVKNASHYLLLM